MTLLQLTSPNHQNVSVDNIVKYIHDNIESSLMNVNPCNLSPRHNPISSNSNITISYLNVNYLANKIRIIEHFISNSLVDILVLTETHTTSTFSCSFPGYQFISLHVPNSYAGMVILIKDNLNFEIESFTSSNKHDLALINLFLSNNIVLRIAALYISPSTTAELFIDPQIAQADVILGDLNAKHFCFGNKSTNKSGKTTLSFIHQHNFLLLNDNTPTFSHVNQNYEEILDLMFIKRSLITVVDCAWAGTDLDVNSDHLPIFLRLNFTPKKIKQFFKMKFDFKNADWDSYASHIENSIPDSNHLFPIDTCRDIDFVTDELTNCILDSAKTSIPCKRIWGRPLPPEIIKIIKQKRTCRRMYQNCKNPIAKSQIKTELNYLGKLIKFQIAEFEANLVNERLISLENNCDNPTEFYKRLRATLKKQVADIPLKDSNNKLIAANSDRANAFAKCLQEKMTLPSNDNHDQNFSQTVQNFIDENKSNLTPLSNISLAEDDCSGITSPISSEIIIHYTKKIKSTSSSDPQGINYDMIKHAPLVFFIHLASLFANILKLGYFPKIWKVGHVKMVHKPGKSASDPNGYRPITLTSCLCKIFERVLNDRLTTYLWRNNLMCRFQAAFRKGHSPIDQIHRLMTSIRLNSSEGKSTSAIFLDVERAFDSVWHQGLKFKFLTSKLPTAVCRILSNYLDNRSLLVNCNHYLSNPFTPLAGVPQGGVLSPTLYSFFVADYPILTDYNINLSIYADDTAYWTSHKSPEIATVNLQNAVVRLISHCRKWKIKINHSKTVAISFSYFKSRRTAINKIKIEDNYIPWSHTIKFLGVTINNNMCFSQNYTITLNNAKRRLASLLPVLKSPHISQKSKTIIYKTVILPTLLYGCQTIAFHSRLKIFAQYDKFQYQCLRIILGIPKFISRRYIDSKLPLTSVSDIMYNLSRKYITKIQNNPNHIASEVI